MWLAYGVSDQRGLVHISDTPCGRSQLPCPYAYSQKLARSRRAKAAAKKRAKNAGGTSKTKKKRSTSQMLGA